MMISIQEKDGFVKFVTVRFVWI